MRDFQYLLTAPEQSYRGGVSGWLRGFGWLANRLTLCRASCIPANWPRERQTPVGRGLQLEH